jgi:hypothetical protein
VLKRQAGLRGVARALHRRFLVAAAVLATVLDEAVGIEGCLSVLASRRCSRRWCAVDPPGGPWLNVAIGKRGEPRTVPPGDHPRPHRLFALEAFLVVCAPAPARRRGPGRAAGQPLLLRSMLVGRVALHRRRAAGHRRVQLAAAALRPGLCARACWAAPGRSAQPHERAAIERRLAPRGLGRPVRHDDGPAHRHPAGPQAQLRRAAGACPPACSCWATTRPRAERGGRGRQAPAATVLERLLTSTRPRVADRGEGTFLVPQCWMVVGLTRDDDRPRATACRP